MNHIPSNEGKPIYFGASILPVAICFVLQNVLAIMGMEFLFALSFRADADKGILYVLKETSDAATDTTFLMLVSVIYAALTILLFSIWYGKRIYPSVPPVGRKPSISFSSVSPLIILSIPLLAISLQYLSNVIVYAVTAISPNSLTFYQDLMKEAGMSTEGTTSLSPLLILYTLFLGPMSEELAFRGLSLGYARRVLPFWAANILQAVLFGALHMNLIQFSYAFFAGLILGYLYSLSGNLLLTMVVHISFNTVGLLLGDYLSFSTDQPWLFAIILFIAMAALWAGIRLFAFSCKGRKDPSSGMAG